MSEEKQFNMLDWLKQYWFIIIAFFTVSAAWGQATHKIQTLEDAVKATAETFKATAETQTQVKVLDERTKSIKDEQVYQREMLKEILRNQQKK